ncbi:MAG TPA: M28 family peptidase, partial [Gemmatimonadaceae bacterium]|nr:M28 family peptidase [Gemmatimonadaceae bacterium]
MVLGRFLLHRVLTFPAMRRSSRNLVATKKGEPKVWLIAHTDSKSQTIAMLPRIASLVLGWFFFLLMIAMMAKLSLGSPVATALSDNLTGVQVSFLSFFTILAAVPFAFCFVTNHSRGALDNASGVAAVLLAVELAGPDRSFGVILTSGEELALAGAKAFVETHHQKGIAINCDTVDDRGRFVCMTEGRRGRAWSALTSGATAAGQKLKARSTIPGILTDSIAFAEGGWDTCTLSRGNLATLGRVHT